MSKAHVALMVVLSIGVLLGFTDMMFDSNEYEINQYLNGWNSTWTVKGNITAYVHIYILDAKFNELI